MEGIEVQHQQQQHRIEQVRRTIRAAFLQPDSVTDHDLTAAHDFLESVGIEYQPAGVQ